MCRDMPPLELAIQFHGHICPGLLMGVRASEFAIQHLELERDRDEELLAVVETNSCGVDAIQAILGCTFGKGNLIFKDYGKAVYTIASRDKGRAVRIAQKYNANRSPLFARYRELNNKAELTSQEKTEQENLLGQIFESIMTAPFEDIFQWREVDFSFPDKAEIRKTLECSVCGEGVMDARAVITANEIVCPTCCIDKGGE